jgi:hypothetical protein
VSSLLLDIHEPASLLSRLRIYNPNPSIIHTDLDSADCNFSGIGPDGEIQVGIERKTLSDLITSMRERRLAGVGGQIQRMWANFDLCFLTVEGVWRPGPGGEIEVLAGRGQGWRPLYDRGGGGDGRGRQAVSYRQLAAFLTMLKAMPVVYGKHLLVDRTANEAETAALWVSIWTTLQKPWHEHRTYKDLWRSGQPQGKGHGAGWAEEHGHDEEFAILRRPGGRATIGVENPTTAWRFAAALPGVGDRRAKGVAEYFGTCKAMAEAGVEEWMAALGIEKGRKTAEAVVRAIREKGA